MTEQRTRLGVIGAGNMGLTIVRGAIENGILVPADIHIAEVDPSRRAIAAGLGCKVEASPEAVWSCENILLAVKPQQFGEMPPMHALDGVIITIMAGIDSARVRDALGPSARVIRAMPNTPCRIGEGMTAIAIGAGAQQGDEAFALRLFGALGRTVLVDEHHMHAVTAVSGSGPAYVFRFAEAMERGAIDAELDPATARLLVQQTILGAAGLMIEAGDDPAVLRAAVTSKGGTTAAALAVIEAGAFETIVREAIAAAVARGRELGA